MRALSTLLVIARALDKPVFRTINKEVLFSLPEKKREIRTRSSSSSSSLIFILGFPLESIHHMPNVDPGLFFLSFSLKPVLSMLQFRKEDKQGVVDFCEIKFRVLKKEKER